MAETKTAVVALFLISLLVASASVPAVSAYGCYDDCYTRCANGKQDTACDNMCTVACNVKKPAEDGVEQLKQAVLH